MSNRITQSDLEWLVKRANEQTGNATEPYTRDGDNLTANIGTYLLNYAYGGVKLVQLVNADGSITCISPGGYGTKRELYNWLRGFVSGLEERS